MSIKSSIRSYRDSDAAPLADIIQRCLLDVNSRDYSPRIIEKLCAYYNAERLAGLSGTRGIFVAESNGIVGTVSRSGNKVYTLFVDPDWSGNGIGRKLMEYVESLAGQEGHRYMETEASITAHGFYQRLGYEDLQENDTELGLLYVMRKALA